LFAIASILTLSNLILIEFHLFYHLLIQPFWISGRVDYAECPFYFLKARKTEKEKQEKEYAWKNRVLNSSLHHWWDIRF